MPLLLAFIPSYASLLSPCTFHASNLPGQGCVSSCESADHAEHAEPAAEFASFRHEKKRREFLNRNGHLLSRCCRRDSDFLRFTFFYGHPLGKGAHEDFS